MSRRGETKAAEGASFEASTERLGKIVAELEKGELPLEKALHLFEEGVALARSAQEKIDRAEKKVEELLGYDTAGNPRSKPIASVREELETYEEEDDDADEDEDEDEAP